MKNEALILDLAKATGFVLDFALGNIGPESFLDAYGNFYYFEALDGHEMSNPLYLRPEVHAVIELHRRVQEDVINCMSLFSYSPEQLAEAGRISGQQAQQRTLQICAELGVASLTRELLNPKSGQVPMR